MWVGCTLVAAAAAAAGIRVEVGADGRKVLTNGPGARRSSGAVRAVARTVAPSSSVPGGSAAAGAARLVLIDAARLDELVAAHAAANSLDPDLVDAVVRVESGYDPRAVSHKGAIGLMQLMPGTAAVLQVDPWDPEENVAGGTRYLRRLLDRFDGDLELALAGYNAGPEAVEQYQGVPPFDETRAYVQRVLGLYYGIPEYSLPAATTGRRVRASRDGSGRIVLATGGHH